MKILQIIYSLGSGGAERFVVDLSNQLAIQENEVVLCILNDDSVGDNGFYKGDISPNVKYISLKLREGFSLSKIFSIYNLIKDTKPDVVHCHHNLINYVFPISLFLKKIKYFHTIHNDAPKEVGSFLEFYLRRFFYRSRRINAITISRESTNSFVQYYKTKSFSEIFNGRVNPTKSETFEIVKRYFDDLRKENDWVFVHIGRYAPQKNQRMLIEVINRLNNQGKRIVLLIIGDGFEHPNAAELRSLTSGNILFLGQKHNIADYLFNADAFCLSSIYEGMPITLIESLACGCIPICTPVGGIVDSIKNGFNGFISKSISEDDYYSAVASYFEQKDNIRPIDLVETYNSMFSIDKCAKKHIQLYLG